MGLCRGPGGLFVSSDGRVWVEMVGHGSIFTGFKSRGITLAFLVRF